VLLLGESGTGKELFARALHQLSSRAQAPFVAVNCAAIPETLIENELFGHERGAYTGADTRRPGRFELAHRGTLFLDEVGELPLPVQAKLLRALEDGRITRLGGQGEVDVDVRVVAATNRDLQQAVFRREFREDLYFRLAVFPVRIPPLRERRSDIADLALHFVGRAGPEIRGRSVGISAEALALLERYDWPGNVRELENCIERACIIAEGDIIGPQDLDLRAVAGAATECDPLQQFDLSGTLAEAVARVQRQIEERKISQALRACEGSRGRAAEMLGITAKTLLAKMRELGMEESK
jgi:transcriptional regulator with GAF, ATPase, and Fis domain